MRLLMVDNRRQETGSLPRRKGTSTIRSTLFSRRHRSMAMEEATVMPPMFKDEAIAAYQQITIGAGRNKRDSVIEPQRQ